ncbi:MAG: methyltransferase domain-containing protein [Candidatus Cloacimonetes bacterium]|nr:methyltransferase domain-containing protein [Candidatus Cloacimonadota bacterium]
MDKKNNYYHNKYNTENYYWGLKPSPSCFEVLKTLQPEKHLKLLDIGCGEGRNAIFFARNGYDVTAFDLEKDGVEKTKKLADKIGVKINVFQADINKFRLEENFDILFSTGTLHYIKYELRKEIFKNYKDYTNVDGIHMFTTLIEKPFIPAAPEKEINSYKWLSGELFRFYHDWKIELCKEYIVDCMSSGIPHKHAINRVLAKKIVF